MKVDKSVIKSNYNDFTRYKKFIGDNIYKTPVKKVKVNKSISKIRVEKLKSL